MQTLAVPLGSSGYKRSQQDVDHFCSLYSYRVETALTECLPLRPEEVGVQHFGVTDRARAWRKWGGASRAIGATIWQPTGVCWDCLHNWHLLNDKTTCNDSGHIEFICSYSVSLCCHCLTVIQYQFPKYLLTNQSSPSEAMFIHNQDCTNMSIGYRCRYYSQVSVINRDTSVGYQYQWPGICRYQDRYQYQVSGHKLYLLQELFTIINASVG